jgi:hypothetical protein
VGKKRHTYMDFVEKHEGERPLERGIAERLILK